MPKNEKECKKAKKDMKKCNADMREARQKVADLLTEYQQKKGV